MKICNPPVVNQCETCFKLCVDYCPDGINISGGLTPNANLYLWVLDKFGNFFRDPITVNVDGSFDIDLNNFPQGLFTAVNGVVNIFVTSDIDGNTLIDMTFDSVQYACAIISVSPQVSFVQNQSTVYNPGTGCTPPGFTVTWGNITGNILNQTDLIDYIATHSGNSSVEFNAQEDILAFQVVTSDGKVADSSLIQQKNKIIGINEADVLTGFVGKATGFGTIKNPSWTWTIGSKIFLNGTTLSTTAPSIGYSLCLGTATKSDTIDVIIQPSILL